MDPQAAYVLGGAAGSLLGFVVGFGVGARIAEPRFRRARSFPSECVDCGEKVSVAGYSVGGRWSVAYLHPATGERHRCKLP